MQLDFENPPHEPLGILRAWIDDAAAAGLPNPNAMTLATVDGQGRPSVRTVLLKGLDERGAVFYTNRLSRKGRSLEASPRAALLFHWDVLGRQASIEGAVSLVSDAESDEYFAGRPRLSQLGAWASRQSEPVAGRAQLDRQLDEVARRYEGRDVPRSPHWGGYRVALERLELWQSREGRLHDRIEYRPADPGPGAGPSPGWRVQRLSP